MKLKVIIAEIYIKNDGYTLSALIKFRRMCYEFLFALKNGIVQIREDEAFAKFCAAAGITDAEIDTIEEEIRRGLLQFLLKRAPSYQLDSPPGVYKSVTESQTAVSDILQNDGLYRELILYLLEGEKRFQRNNPSTHVLRQNINSLMEENHMTVSQLADRAGILEQDLVGILNGDTLTLSPLLKLCLAFNVNTHSIIFGHGPIPSEDAEIDGSR